MINVNGNVIRCANANVLCEKKLARDVKMCLDKTTLATNVNLNASTSISISTFGQTGYFKSSMCIGYCRVTSVNQVGMNESILCIFTTAKNKYPVS